MEMGHQLPSSVHLAKWRSDTILRDPTFPRFVTMNRNNLNRLLMPYCHLWPLVSRLHNLDVSVLQDTA